MDNTFFATQWFESLRVWAMAYVWKLDTLLEILLIALSFTVGVVLARILSRRALKAIDASVLALRTKRLAKSMRRLIFPLISLSILFLVTLLAGSKWIGIDVTLCEAVMKMLTAWIFIRLALQFVDNPFVRSLFTWTIWAVAALSIFGVLDETMAALDSMAITVGAMRISTLEIIKGAILLMIMLYLAIFASSFFERRVLNAKGLTRSSQVLIAKIIRMALVVVAIVIGITSAGIDLSIFAVFSGAVGLGIGFGLQRSVSNLFSGLMLLVDQSIRPGDIIELDQNSQTFGWVNEMAARYTEIVTRDNKSYLIPNEDLVTQRVVNWSHGNRLIRLDISFGVHYNSNPHEVIALALDVVRKPSRIAKTPEPQCFLKEFGESSINFLLYFWIEDVENGTSNIKSEILLGLWDSFKKNGIEIPYPHREVYLHETKKAS